MIKTMSFLLATPTIKIRNSNQLMEKQHLVLGALPVEILLLQSISHIIFTKLIHTHCSEHHYTIYSVHCIVAIFTSNNFIIKH